MKPFVDHYDYHPGHVLVADETYIKVRSVKSYIWFIMDSVSRSIIGYSASMDRSVGPCIQAMRQAFQKLKNHLPEGFRFIADGYSAYPLAAQQFFREFGDRMKFEITQVIGLTNSDAVTTEFRPMKQLIERLNRTTKLLTGQRTASTALPAPTMTLPFGSLTTTFFVRILTHMVMC